MKRIGLPSLLVAVLTVGCSLESAPNEEPTEQSESDLSSGRIDLVDQMWGPESARRRSALVSAFPSAQTTVTFTNDTPDCARTWFCPGGYREGVRDACNEFTASELTMQLSTNGGFLIDRNAYSTTTGKLCEVGRAHIIWTGLESKPVATPPKPPAPQPPAPKPPTCGCGR